MVGLLDGGGGLLPFADRWNPVGQMMTPADPTMRAGLLALAQRLRNPTAVPPENGAPPTNAMASGILPNAPPMQPGPQNAQTPAIPNSGGGFWSGLGNAISANPLTLMALGGGIARGGFGAGLQQAAPVAAQERQFNLQQQTMAGAYQALKEAGFPEAVARAGALNPQVLSTIENIRHQHATEQQAATAPVKIGTDAWGADIYAVRDPNAPGGYRRINLSDGSAQPGVAPGSSPQLTGQDYLNTLPPERRALIEKVANYEANPASFSIRNGQRERTIAEASQFRPDYDQRNFASSQAALTKFTSGQQGNAIKSFNVAIDHLDQLAELGTSLKNGDLRPVNALKNWFQTEIGSAPPTNFEGLKAIVGQEVVKAIVANGGGEREREEAGRQLSRASSPEQLAGIVSTYKAAMGAQLAGLKQEYEQGTLRRDFDRLLSAKAKAEMAKHQPGEATQPAAPATALPSGWSVTVK